jgi:hypothetical protein
MYLIRKLLFIIFLILVIAGFSSCSKEPPEINDLFKEIVMFKDVERNTVYQKLSVFVLASDADGIEDIEKLYVINDEKDLYWEADQNTFAKPLLNSQTWIGINSVSMNDYSPLPRGEYRIVVTDLGGESAERSVQIDYVDFTNKDIAFPLVSIGKDDIGITGKSTDYIIWLYDLSGNYLDLVYYTGKKVSINAILLKNQKAATGFTFYVYSSDASIQMGLVSGPYHYTKP